MLTAIILCALSLLVSPLHYLFFVGMIILFSTISVFRSDFPRVMFGFGFVSQASAFVSIVFSLAGSAVVSLLTVDYNFNFGEQSVYALIIYAVMSVNPGADISRIISFTIVSILILAVIVSYTSSHWNSVFRGFFINEKAKILAMFVGALISAPLSILTIALDASGAFFDAQYLFLAFFFVAQATSFFSAVLVYSIAKIMRRR